MSIPRAIEPVLLLLAAGFCIGLIFPLGKMSADLGLSPLVYAGASAAGAGLVLAIICVLAGQHIVVDRQTLLYAGIAGQLTYAIPFGTMMVVIPQLGSGIPAILQSLAPILTLAIVYALGLERPNLSRAVGLLIGMLGALVILFVRHDVGADGPVSIGWYILALVTPASLGAGNVFRSTHWPKGQGPLPLAMMTLVAASVGILVLIALLALAGGISDPLASVAAGWGLIAAQSLAIGIGYAFFFRLQQVGGPVYLSQISYVNTGVGVAFAVLLFGERLSVYIWLAVALIVAGVAVVNRSASAAK